MSCAEARAAAPRPSSSGPTTAPTGNGRAGCWGPGRRRWRRWSSRSGSTRGIWCWRRVTRRPRRSGCRPTSGRRRGSRARWESARARWCARSPRISASRVASRSFRPGRGCVPGPARGATPARRRPEGAGAVWRRSASTRSASWRRSTTRRWPVCCPAGWGRSFAGGPRASTRGRSRTSPRRRCRSATRRRSTSTSPIAPSCTTAGADGRALADSLVRHEWTARTVTTKLRYPDFSIVTRSHSLTAGTADAERIGGSRCKPARPRAGATAGRAAPGRRGRLGFRAPRAAHAALTAGGCPVRNQMVTSPGRSGELPDGDVPGRDRHRAAFLTGRARDETTGGMTCARVRRGTGRDRQPRGQSTDLHRGTDARAFRRTDLVQDDLAVRPTGG